MRAMLTCQKNEMQKEYYNVLTAPNLAQGKSGSQLNFILWDMTHVPAKGQPGL